MAASTTLAYKSICAVSGNAPPYPFLPNNIPTYTEWLHYSFKQETWYKHTKILKGFWTATFIKFNDPDQQFRIFPRMRTFSSLKIYSYVPPHINSCTPRLHYFSKYIMTKKLITSEPLQMNLHFVPHNNNNNKGYWKKEVLAEEKWNAAKLCEFSVLSWSNITAPSKQCRSPPWGPQPIQWEPLNWTLRVKQNICTYFFVYSPDSNILTTLKHTFKFTIKHM